MAKKANVRKLVLTHFPPWPVDEKTILDRLGKIYTNEVIFGEDILEISPQAGSGPGQPSSQFP